MLGLKYSSNSQKRIFGYDLIKTIAIFMIVFYHVGGIDYGTIIPGEYYLPNFNKTFSTLCAAGVPLLLMVNGALVVHKNPHWKLMLLKSAHLLFLLFFWKYVLQFLISNHLMNIKAEMVHFWFLSTLSIVYIVSVAFLRNYSLRKYVLAFLLIFPFLYNFLWDIYLFFSPTYDCFKITHTGFFTLYAILYFYLGDSMREKHISLICSLGLIVTGLLLVNFEVVVMSNHYGVIYDGVNSSFPTYGALAMSMGFFLLLKGVIIQNELIKVLVSFIGHNTMGIYLFHVLLIFSIRKYCLGWISGTNIFVSLFISILIIMISASISRFINNTKVGFLVNLSPRS